MRTSCQILYHRTEPTHHVLNAIVKHLGSSRNSTDLIFKHTPTIGLLTISAAPILAQPIAKVYSAYGQSLLTGIGFYYGTMWTQEPKVSFMLKHPPNFPGWPICCSFVPPLFIPLHIHELPKRSLNTQTCLAQTLGRMSLCLKCPSPTCMPSSLMIDLPSFPDCPYLLYFLP